MEIFFLIKSNVYLMNHFVWVPIFQTVLKLTYEIFVKYLNVPFLYQMAKKAMPIFFHQISFFLRRKGHTSHWYQVRPQFRSTWAVIMVKNRHDHGSLLFV